MENHPEECDYWGIRLAQEIGVIKPGEKDCDGILQPEGRPGLFPAPHDTDHSLYVKKKSAIDGLYQDYRRGMVSGIPPGLNREQFEIVLTDPLMNGSITGSRSTFQSSKKD